VVVAKVAAKAETKAAMVPVFKAVGAARGLKLKVAVVPASKVAVMPALKVAAVLASRVEVANLAPRHKAEAGLAPKASSRALKRAVVLASREASRESIREPGLASKASSRALKRAVVLASKAVPTPPLAELLFAHPAAMPIFALPRPMPVLVSAAMRVQKSVVVPRPMPASALASMLEAAHSPAPRLPWTTC
jgi:hypothetical protein